MAELVGKTVGKYRIVARLGRGGMAEVYKAYQPGLDRYVAIKVLHSHLVDDKDFIGRFEREALAVGKLRHPNIVQALDFDREGEMYFMAMEFIDGPTLKEELRARKAANKPYTLREIARIFTALCSAIDYAHARSMVHRDLKPANVMINQEGQVVLTDFGIARIMGATQYTQTGALSGTPAYMSPEQGQGERGDKRSDIYSLGVILYEMVTGVVPYDADTPFAVIMKHINEPLPLPTHVNPNIPEVIERIILKAMSKSPEDRYQTAGEMAQAVREAVGMTPEESFDYRPLPVVALPPQIEHTVVPTTAVEQASATVGKSSSTVLPGQDDGTTNVITATRPPRSVPILPVVVGAIIVLLLIVGVIFGALTFVRRNQRTIGATQTAQVAAINVTETVSANNQATEVAVQMVNATATAQIAPTETVLAATTEAARVAATETAQFERDAALVNDALARASTVTAEAIAVAIAAGETATAESLPNIASPSEVEDTATPPATDTPEATVMPTPTDSPTMTPVPELPTPAPVPVATPTPTTPADTPTPELPALSGKLAVPVDNGAGRYDVFIYSLPDGQQIGRIDGAHQPNFRADGVKLLVNGEGGGFGENVFEANPGGAIDRPVSDSPTDSYPVYSPDGGRVAYSNPQLAIGSDGSYHNYVFVQCGLIPPAQEGDQNCRDVARFGILVPNGQIGEVQGGNPVWTADDRIIYKGCNSWAGGGSCGIFATVSWGNKRGGNGATPTKLIDGTSVTPTDTKGNLIAFHSRETGDWEAYVVQLNGSGITNISNSSSSSDGLPTISPDGRWVAFVSDRSGNWAVWVAPSSGGEAQKLLDFPKANPWATGAREWINERISWGP